MKLILKKPALVFDLVGHVQERLRGNHFCALKMNITAESVFTVLPCAFTDPLPEHQINGKQVSLRLDRESVIFEHFLQRIRAKFPGISFDMLELAFEGTACVVRQIAFIDKAA